MNDPDGTFGPNEERYKAASEPHADESAAEQALYAFFAEFAELRVKHKVAEVLCVAASWHGDIEKPTIVARSAAFGDARLFPDMAAAMHRVYVQPILDRADNLQPKKRRK